MKHYPLSFRDLLSRYHRYTRKLARVWHIKERREFFAKKIEQLKLQLVQMKASYRTAMAGTALAAGLLGATSANAQQFLSQGTNPFGLTPTTYINSPEFADLDGDGDLDILTYDLYSVPQYYENTGTATAPAFAAPIANPFGILTGYGYVNRPSLVDIDGDGDLDLFVSEYYAGNIQFYQNTGTATAPTFLPGGSFPFGLTSAGGYTYSTALEFADMDNDGDYDMLLSFGYPAEAYYYQNDGTASSAAFAAPIPASAFGITPPYYSTPTAADIDGDGDFDVFAFGNDELVFFENTGSATTASFAASVTAPFGLDFDGFGSTKGDFVDFNGDGVLDLAFGDSNGNFYIYYGHGITTSINGSTSVCSGETITFALTADDSFGGTLTVTTSSSNPTAVANADVSVTGTQPNYTVTVTPTGSGISSVVFNISNGSVTIQESATLSIGAVTNVGNTIVCAGENAVLRSPDRVAWYSSANGTTPLSISDSLSIGVVANDTSYFVAIADSVLQIDSVDATTGVFADYETLGGDNRTGIAVTTNYVYVNGDDFLTRYDADMTNPITLPVQDGFFSDLASGTLYSLWNSTDNVAPEGTDLYDFVVDEIAVLDDMMDTVSFITLSTPIVVGGINSTVDKGGIYSGEGFVAIHSGNTDNSVYVIELPSGQVIGLGEFEFLDRPTGENWADWGFATRTASGDYYLYSFNEVSSLIYRVNVATGAKDTIFDIGEELTEGALAFSPWNNRLYIDWEYDATFFTGDENAGYYEVTTLWENVVSACREEVEVSVASIGYTETVVDEIEGDGSGSISLSVTGGAAPYTYNWSNSETTAAITGLSEGTYDVTITDANGCSETATFTVDNLVGIAAVNSLAAKVFPNPTTGQFYVELNQPGQTQVTVLDLTGREVATAQGDGASRIALDLGNTASGVYFVRIQQGNASAVKKLVIE